MKTFASIAAALLLGVGLSTGANALPLTAPAKAVSTVVDAGIIHANDRGHGFQRHGGFGKRSFSRKFGHRGFSRGFGHRSFGHRGFSRGFGHRNFSRGFGHRGFNKHVFTHRGFGHRGFQNGFHR